MRGIFNLKLTSDKRRLIENFFSLFILQAMNYIFPLITLPYLVRVLGPEKFGLISFSQTFVQYFSILTDYGFSLSATREISIYRENKEKIVEIFSSVMVIKFALLVFSLIIMTFIVLSFGKFMKDWLVYYLTFGIVIGQVLFPAWFFQGMEKMRYIAILNAIAKLISTISIFVFIKKTSDYLYVPLINSIAIIVIGIISLWLIYRDFNIKVKFTILKEMKYQLKEGWPIFISSFASNFYRNFNILVLGILCSNIYVGYYAIAEKIIKALQALQIVAGNTLFPFLSKKISANERYFFDVDIKFRKYIISTYGLMVVLILFFSSYIIYFVSGEFQENIILDLRIMAIVILIGGLNYYYGILGLIVMNYKKEFSEYILIAGLSNIFFSFFFVFFLKDIGASLSFVLSELILLFLTYNKVKQLKSMFSRASNTKGV